MCQAQPAGGPLRAAFLLAGPGATGPGPFHPVISSRAGLGRPCSGAWLESGSPRLGADDWLADGLELMEVKNSPR